MKSRRLVKSRRRYKKQSKISVNGKANLESIPIDLILEILSRLPAKFITRCRCVCKLWASILCHTYFTELFLTRSQARPQLLFTCHKPKTGELFFLSSPQPQYSDGNSSSSLATAIYHMKLPYCRELPYYREGIRISHMNGLVCLNGVPFPKRGTKGKEKSMICNPSAGQSLVLPKVKTNKKDLVFSFFGYDPIEKQFKVLSIDYSMFSEMVHKVMTLGTKEMSWRKVECCMPHFPSDKVICINGVLYYRASCPEGTMIVCFDIRYEKFRFMNIDSNITHGATLVNYNGKLGSIVTDWRVFTRSSTRCVLWILEDTEKHEWSKRIHVLPPSWKDVLGDFNENLDVLGMVGGNEIVFSTSNNSLPFYLFYYNIERNTFRRVEIQGLEGWEGHKVHTFLNHVEDIKLVDGY